MTASVRMKIDHLILLYSYLGTALSYDEHIAIIVFHYISTDGSNSTVESNKIVLFYIEDADKDFIKVDFPKEECKIKELYNYLDSKYNLKSRKNFRRKPTFFTTKMCVLEHNQVELD
ncbi:MAG: hypothetical protein NZ521_03100 [Flammeovirgaceae bacterium]|nr:hypothetical protein [Flammeovirgaceae bacterium]MDW8287139.1 hypothetical protein [Flammeovirgaceae bacterium]